MSFWDIFKNFERLMQDVNFSFRRHAYTNGAVLTEKAIFEDILFNTSIQSYIVLNNRPAQPSNDDEEFFASYGAEFNSLDIDDCPSIDIKLRSLLLYITAPEVLCMGNDLIIHHSDVDAIRFQDSGWVRLGPSQMTTQNRSYITYIHESGAILQIDEDVQVMMFDTQHLL